MVEWKLRGRIGVVCGGIGHGDEDACVFLGIWILILISILTVNGLYVLISAVEFSCSRERCRGVYDGVGDGGNALLLCRCSGLRNASFVFGNPVHDPCVCVIGGNSDGYAYGPSLADVS